MEVSHDDAKTFAVARRETRKHIASFEETKYDFLCRDDISFILFIAKRRNRGFYGSIRVRNFETRGSFETINLPWAL